jgi:hypothetical protein
MYKLIYENFNVKHEVTANTYEEILEQCLNVFNHDGVPLEIYEEGVLLKSQSDIYHSINKRYY